MEDASKIPMKKVVKALSVLEEKEKVKITLLGIGPMSERVIRASIELGKEEDFPVILIPSRNQIDIDEFGSGYVMNWDQKRFSDTVDKICREIGFRGILYKWRDHGGPWQRDEEYKEKLPIEEAMVRAKRTYISDMKNGFTVLHIDPTKDPHENGAVPTEKIIARIVELIEWIESERIKLGLEVIDYEVGTEEQKGGATGVDTFEKFLKELDKKLSQKKLPKPVFIVGQTGTLLKMKKNVGEYNITMTKELAGIAKKYGIGFKEHNTDYLKEELLSKHPDIGIGMANVAPEFAHAETGAYLRLAEMENEISKEKKIDVSDFFSVIGKAVLNSGRWKKWLLKDDMHLTEKDILSDSKKFKEIVIVNGHYVYNQKEVREAISKLFANLKQANASDSPERIVIQRIKEVIKKYVDTFNLKGLTSKILRIA